MFVLTVTELKAAPEKSLASNAEPSLTDAEW